MQQQEERIMSTPYKAEDERVLRVSIESAQKSMAESFALIVRRLREKADDIERQTMRAVEAGLDGALAGAYVNIADAVLNEIEWLSPNLPVSQIQREARRLVQYEAILQQMGVLVTDEERAGEAALAANQAIVDKVKAMIEAGVPVKVSGNRIVDVAVGGYGYADRPIMFRLKGRKYMRTATTADVEELKAADNPSYVSRRSVK